jgi:exopolysaccharide biosynthesis polyprenyl glycosylphosphotransferase
MQADHDIGRHRRARREIGELEDEIAFSSLPAPAHPETDVGEGVVIDLRQDYPVIELVGAPPLPGLLGASRAEEALKRLMDMVGAILGLVVLSPLFLIIAVAIRLTSSGPVFYVSDRVGRDGKTFRFLKFRTMHVTADRDKSLLIDLNEVDGPVFKIREDPRITAFGRFLRRSSLDELPQLIHVLTGRMSLVGPRPPIPAEVAEYDDHQWRRLAVKPGLTCLWQVSGRSTLDFETWVELDLHYIENWSLLYDFQLIARTVPAVFSGRGAF